MIDTAAEDRVEAFEGRALGSALRLHVRIPDAVPGEGSDAWTAVRAEFDSVDAALSRFRDDSELTALNRLAGSGSGVSVSWRLREAVAIMARASRLTGGRFDPTVLADLERLGEHGAPIGGGPDDGVAPTGALERPRTISAPPRPLDTGGIGKGLALRWAARRAAAVLPDGAGLLLEAGGDIVAAGVPPADAWRVAIEDPVAEGTPGAEPVVVILVEDGAVATSSVRVRHWVAPDGRAVHHLVNPRTREPARTGLLAVTVAGADPAWAEVWTKALFLAGRDAIADEARARDLAAWWVTDEGRLGMSPAGARPVAVGRGVAPRLSPCGPPVSRRAELPAPPPGGVTAPPSTAGSSVMASPLSGSPSASRSSATVAIPSRAPARVTESDAATTARLAAVSRSSPLARAAASDPLSASPAPVASTALTFGALMSIGLPSFVTSTAPDEPSDTRNALRAPGPSDVVSSRILAARIGSSLPEVGRPDRRASSAASRLSSPRFGVTTSASESIVRSIPSAGAGLRTVRAPPSLPIRSASRAAAVEISWVDEDDVALVRVRAGRAPCGRARP